MKGNSKRLTCYKIAMILFLITVGILVNQWTLSYCFSSLIGESLSAESKTLVWLFRGFCIVTALFIWLAGSNSKSRKNLKFTIIALLLGLVAIETALHVSRFILRIQSHQKHIDPQTSLSPYDGKDWAEKLFVELEECSPAGFEQFLGWDREEYHGRYTNIDTNGIRKTWNPDGLGDQLHSTIYVFGGSTIWGYGARDDYTIPSYMSKMLNRDGYNCIITNYGEGGYTFTQEVIQMILLLRDGHRPDYIVFYNGANDVYSSYQGGVAGNIQNLKRIKKKLKQKPLSPVKHFITGIQGMFREYCLIYKSTKNIMALFHENNRFRETASNYTELQLMSLSRDTAEYYLKTLDLLEKLSQVYDFKYICFWQPVAPLEKTLTDEERTLKRINDKAFTTLHRQTYNYIISKSPLKLYDITGVLKDRKVSYYTDIYHLSEEGNEVVADKIVEIVKREFFHDE